MWQIIIIMVNTNLSGANIQNGYDNYVVQDVVDVIILWL